jgi:hypothetical protein
VHGRKKTSGQTRGPLPSLRRTLDRLSRLYEAWDKPEKAAEWRAKRDQTLKPKENPGAK